MAGDALTEIFRALDEADVRYLVVGGDGTTVHVVGLDDLRFLKRNAGRPKDLDDIEKLDEIARATLETDEQDA
ncbi:MAG: hypothetical protein JRJ10_05915 [Deltaproteobacteria bacterium]|nr:hypothetical protein [Deltaproteobacteria bacterium]MBW2405687.1 hypothetical protein [Deltaproteobacteria bacterium]